MRWTTDEYQAYLARRAAKQVDKDCPRDNVGDMPIPFTEAEDEVIRKYYTERKGAAVCLNELAGMVGRSRWSVAMRASRLGLGDYFRPATEDAKKNMSVAQKSNYDTNIELIKKLSESSKQWHKTHQHPKGMLGKHHTQEVKDAISSANIGRPRPPERTLSGLKTRFANNGTLSPRRPHGSWIGGWREIGGQRIFTRSRWESNYARYLQFQKDNGLIAGWQYEAETFWFEGIKRGCMSYLPDFKVTLPDGSIEYHEVKGWMDARSKTKLKRMKKYHPSVVVKVFDSAWYKANSRNLSGIIKDWESPSPSNK